MSQEPEVRLAQVEDSLARWLGSKWTMYVTRLVILMIPIAGTMFWFAWSSVQTAAVTEVMAVKNEVATVKTTLGVRAADSESFQVEVRKAVADLGGKVDDLGDDMFATKVDVGVIKRLVTELRNQQVTDAAKLGPAGFDQPVMLAASMPRAVRAPEPFPAPAR